MPFIFEHNVNRIQIVGLRAMPHENAAGHIALQRRKAKYLFSITPENESNEPVAKSAYAIVKEDWMRHEPSIVRSGLS